MSELDTFETHGDYLATFTTDELTALCPFDFGGPDFYKVTIRYKPDGLAVESKSLKQYLEKFRDKEITAEGLASEIYTDVDLTIEPNQLYIRLEQARRGGLEEIVEKGDYELRQ